MAFQFACGRSVLLIMSVALTTMPGRTQAAPSAAAICVSEWPLGSNPYVQCMKRENQELRRPTQNAPRPEEHSTTPVPPSAAPSAQPTQDAVTK